MVVDRDALVRKGVDAGDLGCEGRIGQVTERQPLAFDEYSNDIRACSEIQDGWFGDVRRRFGLRGLDDIFLAGQFQNLIP